MDPRIMQFSQNARQAIAQRNGRVLHENFVRILQIDPVHPEGQFLKGMFFKVQNKRAEAMAAFEQSFQADAGRYDSAIELAELCLAFQDNARAVGLIRASEKDMSGSPYYLNLAGEIYTRLGLHDAAWPLFNAANDIQKDAPLIEENLAASAAKLGQLDVAQRYYEKLLAGMPKHQRNHFELSRLSTAKNKQHIQAMEALLQGDKSPGASNIFLYFALGKEYEDLGEWEKAFRYLELGNKFAAEQAKASGYDVNLDIEVLTAIEGSCTAQWLAQKPKSPILDPAPIFIVGLPRTGTTLVERIVASHSMVETVGESFFLDTAIKNAAGQAGARDISKEVIRHASRQSAEVILAEYMQAVQYRRSGKEHFIEKLPLNFLNIGFILKAMPKAKVISLTRKPMDACFAMFKQAYFRFSYNLEDLAEYYIAFDGLRQHWDTIARERIIKVSYEDLVHNPDTQIRVLIEKTGLEFEPECLNFHLSKTASATASFAQIRRKTHTGSVNRWLEFKDNLQPLINRLEAAGIDVTPY